MAPATLPGYNIQHITKKYSVSKHHQKNMGDNNKREPEQQHQIKLGVTHATDSSEKQKNYQGLPKLQTLLPEPQSLLAPSPAQSISLHECQPSPILRKLGIRPQSQATLLTEEIRVCQHTHLMQTTACTPTYLVKYEGACNTVQNRSL